MRTSRQVAGGDTADRERFEKLFFEVQKDRIVLTGAIMQLRGGGGSRRPRLVLHIIVSLLRLQRANRRAMAALGLSKLP